MLPTYVKPLSSGSVFPWLTADRIVTTNSLSQLATPSSVSTAQSLTLSGSATLTIAGLLTAQSGLTVASTTTLSAQTASRILTTNTTSAVATPSSVSTDQSLTLSGSATMTVAGLITAQAGLTIASTVTLSAQTANRILTTSSTSTASTPSAISTAQTLTLSTTTGTTITVSSTTDSTSKDTGSIVTEGGIGVEKAVVVGTTLTVNGLTSGRVPYLSTSGLFTDNAGFQFTPSGSYQLIIGDGTTAQDSYAFMRSPAGQIRAFLFRTGSNNRWLFGANNNAETGSNAGSSFILSAYTDAGGGIDTPITITRAAGGSIALARPLTNTGSILSSNATTGIGYATGAGGAVTQITSRTTGVTLNNVCGEITLVSAAGTATWQSFTVTNSAMAATDNVIVNQKSGTDLYMTHVTAKAAGSFRISFATTGGTTSEQPVFGFSIIKSVAA